MKFGHIPCFMSKQNNNTLFNPKYIILAILFCTIGSLHASAQGEKEKNFPDTPSKNGDVISTYENHEGSSNEANHEYNLRQSSLQKETKSGTKIAVKKENPLYKQGSDKEIKKDEKSTLSFNLFLYIIDKFKEDNL